MSDQSLPGVLVTTAEGDELKAVMEHMGRLYNEWTARAARGECAWICPDCGATFSEGMPDQCEWGHQSCTDLNARDKRNATA